MRILHWNVKSFPARKIFLQKLIIEQSPQLVCLSEIRKRAKPSLTIPDYNFITFKYDDYLMDVGIDLQTNLLFGIRSTFLAVSLLQLNIE